MCRLKRWPPKSPQRNTRSQEPEKLFDYRALIWAPNHSGPGFGPRKVVYHSGPEKMAGGHKNGGLQRTLEKHAQGLEKLFDSGPDSGPETLFHLGPGFGPRKVVYHSGPERMAGGHKCAD